MDVFVLTTTRSVLSRLLCCLGLLAILGITPACSGDLDAPAGDPTSRALTSPFPATSPAPATVPDLLAAHDHDLDALPANALPGQVPSAPWEVVLRYPPEVEAKVLERWERHRLLRDSGTTVVYLNFEGQVIHVANDSDATTNTSWVPNVSGSTVTIPAFNHSYFGSDRAQVISSIVSQLQQLYLGYNIQFVTTRPTSGNYMMTVVGGKASTIGMEYGVLGVSPLDCAAGENLNLNPIDINFICSDDIGSAFHMSLRDLCYTIAHENGHTYGLAHINRTNDIMYYASSGNVTLSWGAAATRSGEQNCSTNNYQDDAVYLTKALGGGGANPETTPPTVAITAPANGSAQPDYFTVSVTATDASGISSVELWLDGAKFDSTWSAPYQFTLYQLTAGSHQLVAKASDLFGNVGTSATVTVTVQGAQPTGCQSNAECGTNQMCQNGTCVNLPPTPMGGALGADCDRNEDCVSGWCIFGEQNYCTQACNEAQGVYCPAGFDCSPDGFCLSATTIPPGATGAPCATNAQCRSGICVDGANSGFCSAVCEPQGTVCPNQSACIDSGDGQTYICDRPPTGEGGGNNANNVGGGGCAVAPTSNATGLGGLALLLVLGALGRRRAGVVGRKEVHRAH